MPSPYTNPGFLPDPLELHPELDDPFTRRYRRPQSSIAPPPAPAAPLSDAYAPRFGDTEARRREQAAQDYTDNRSAQLEEDRKGQLRQMTHQAPVIERDPTTGAEQPRLDDQGRVAYQAPPVTPDPRIAAAVQNDAFDRRQVETPAAPTQAVARQQAPVARAMQSEEDKRAAGVQRGLKAQGVEMITEIDGRVHPKRDEQGRTIYKPAVLSHFEDRGQGNMVSVHRDRFGNEVDVPLKPQIDNKTGEKYVVSADGVTRMSLGVDQDYVLRKDSLEAGKVSALARNELAAIKSQQAELKTRITDYGTDAAMIQVKKTQTDEDRANLQQIRANIAAAVKEQDQLKQVHDAKAEESQTATATYLEKRGLIIDKIKAKQAPPTFETKLDPSQESQFQYWKKQQSTPQNVIDAQGNVTGTKPPVIDPRDTGQDYDYRGAFKAGAKPDANGHWPDEFKKPNHPTFSEDSIYAAQAPEKAGKWDANGNFVRPGGVPPTTQAAPTPEAAAPAEIQQSIDQQEIERNAGLLPLAKGLAYLRNVGIEALSAISPEMSARVFGRTTSGLRPEEIAAPLISLENAKEFVGQLPAWAGGNTAVGQGLAEGISGALSSFSAPGQIAQLPAFALPGVAETYVLDVLHGLPDQGKKLWGAIKEHGLNSKEVGSLAAEYGITDFTAFLAAKGTTAERFRTTQRDINAAPTGPTSEPETPSGPETGPVPESPQGQGPAQPVGGTAAAPKVPLTDADVAATIDQLRGDAKTHVADLDGERQMLQVEVDDPATPAAEKAQHITRIAEIDKEISAVSAAQPKTEEINEPQPSEQPTQRTDEPPDTTPGPSRAAADRPIPDQTEAELQDQPRQGQDEEPQPGQRDVAETERQQPDSLSTDEGRRLLERDAPNLAATATKLLGLEYQGIHGEGEAQPLHQFKDPRTGTTVAVPVGATPKELVLKVKESRANMEAPGDAKVTEFLRDKDPMKPVDQGGITDSAAVSMAKKLLGPEKATQRLGGDNVSTKIRILSARQILAEHKRGAEYAKHYDIPAAQLIDSVAEMPWEQFKTWARNGDHTKKAVAPEHEAIISMYRGDGGGSEGLGNFFHPDKEFARNFTDQGKDSEIKQSAIRESDVFTAKELPAANVEKEMDATIAEAKRQGFKAIYADEGSQSGYAPSIFVFDKSAILPSDATETTPGPSQTVAEKPYRVNVNTDEHKNLVLDVNAVSPEDAVAQARANPDVRFVHEDTARETPSSKLTEIANEPAEQKQEPPPTEVTAPSPQQAGSEEPASATAPVAEAGQAASGASDELKQQAELREDLGVSEGSLANYDPSVRKIGKRWTFDTLSGKDGPLFDTKSEAADAARAHKELKQDQYDNPSDYRDIVSVRARKRLAIIEKYQAEGMSEMAAGERARQEIPYPAGDELKQASFEKELSKAGAKLMTDWHAEANRVTKAASGSDARWESLKAKYDIVGHNEAREDSGTGIREEIQARGGVIDYEHNVAGPGNYLGSWSTPLREIKYILRGEDRYAYVLNGRSDVDSFFEESLITKQPLTSSEASNVFSELREMSDADMAHTGKGTDAAKLAYGEQFARIVNLFTAGVEKTRLPISLDETNISLVRDNWLKAMASHGRALRWSEDQVVKRNQEHAKWFDENKTGILSIARQIRKEMGDVGSSPSKEATTNRSVMTFDEFSASQGLSVTPPSFPEFHRAAGGVSKPSAKSAAERVATANAEWSASRERLRREYDEKVSTGEIREPTRTERLQRTASGTGEAAAAANRILERQSKAGASDELKRGIEKLPPIAKQVMSMRAEGKTNAEISAAMGRSEKEIETVYQVATRKLNAELEAAKAKSALPTDESGADALRPIPKHQIESVRNVSSNRDQADFIHAQAEQARQSLGPGAASSAEFPLIRAENAREHAAIGASHLLEGKGDKAQWLAAMREEYGIRDATPAELNQIWRDSHSLLSDFNDAQTGKALRPKTQIEKATGIRPNLGSVKEQLQNSITKAEGLGEYLRGLEKGGKMGAEARQKQLAIADKWMSADQEQVRHDLIGYVNRALPVAERGRFIGAITRALRRPDLVTGDPATMYRNAFRVMQAIENRSDVVYKGEVIRDVKAAIDRSIESPGVDVSYRQRIREATEGFGTTNPRPSTIESMKRVNAYIEKLQAAGEEVSADMLDRVAGLSKVPLSDLPIPALESLRTKIQLLEKLGRENVKSRKIAWEREKSDRMAAMKAAISTPLEKNPIFKPQPGERGDVTMMQRVGNWLNRGRNAFGMEEQAHAPMDEITDLLGASKATYDGWLEKNIRGPLDLDFNAETREGIVLRDGLQRIITKHGLTIDDLELIQVHGMQKMEGGVDRLEEMGISNATQKRAENLTERQAEAYQYGRVNYDSLLPRIQRTARALDNVEVKAVDNYVPLQRDHAAFNETQVSTPGETTFDEDNTSRQVINDITGGSHLSTKATQGFTKERVQNAKTAVRLNFADIFNRHTTDALHYVYSQPDLRMAGQIVRSPEFAEKFGKDGQSIYMDFLDSVARQGGVNRFQRIAAVDWARRATSRGAIAFRLSSGLVHASQFALQILHSGGAQYWARGVRAVLSREGQAFLRENAAESFVRSGGEPAQAEAELMSKVSKAGFFLPRNVDRIGAQATFLGRYFKEMEAKGLSPDQALAAPVDESAQMLSLVRMRRAVASPLTKDVPQALSRGKGYGGNVSVARGVNQFRNIFLDNWSNVRHDLIRAGVMDAIRNGLDGDNASRIAAVTVAIITSIAAETAIKYGVKKGISAAVSTVTGNTNAQDDKTFLEDFKHHALNRIPVIGQALSAAIYGETGIPVIDAAVKPLHEAATYVKSKKPETKMKHAFRAAGSAATLFGVPGIGQAADIVQGLIKTKPTPSQLVDQVRRGDMRGVGAAVERAAITKKQFKEIMDRAQRPEIVDKVEQMNLEDAEEAYANAKGAEADLIGPVLVKKRLAEQKRKESAQELKVGR